MLCVSDHWEATRNFPIEIILQPVANAPLLRNATLQMRGNRTVGDLRQMLANILKGSVVGWPFARSFPPPFSPQSIYFVFVVVPLCAVVDLDT